MSDSAFELASRPLSYAFPDYGIPPSAQPTTATTKKKRSHGKARPPGHIPRPPNAFIIYRTEYIKSMGTHSTPEISKSLGDRWKSMSALQKKPWVEKAKEAKEKHAELHPNYKYKPVHPRDEQGRCIRKARRANRPRGERQQEQEQEQEEPLEDLSAFSWMETPTAVPPSSPSPSASPTPSANFSFGQPSWLPSPSLPSASLLPYRRSSSVPLPTSSGEQHFPSSSFMPPPPSSFPDAPSYTFPTPSDLHTGPTPRRLSKRPSTSMDFTCAGPNPFSSTDFYASYADSWRPVHRRSISAPGPLPQDGQYLAVPAQPQPAYLTPINPDFGNVFDKFSWDTSTSSSSADSSFPSEDTQPPAQIVPPAHPYTSIGLGMGIPGMTHSPISASPHPSPTHSTASPTATRTPMTPASAPALQHPVPVAAFDFGAFGYGGGAFHADAEHRSYGPESREEAFCAPVTNDDGLGLGLENAHGEGYQYAPQEGYYHDAHHQHHQQGAYPQSYPQPQQTHGQDTLHFNELIVEGY